MDAVSNDLNIQCLCTSLDRKKLFSALEAETGADFFSKYFSESHTATISDVPVFIERRQMQMMQDIIAAVEAVAMTDAYQQAVLDGPPQLQSIALAPSGSSWDMIST